MCSVCADKNPDPRHNGEGMKRTLPILILLLLAAPAAADVVHLKSGGKLEGIVTDLGTKVRIETDKGIITVPKSQVLKIEKKEYKLPEPYKKDPKKKPPRLKTKLTSVYANAFLAFKIYLPAQWGRGRTHSNASCSFYGPKDVAYIPRMDLTVERKSTDLGELVTKYKDGFKKAFEDAIFEEEGATTINGKNAYQFLVKFRQGEIIMNAL